MMVNAVFQCENPAAEGSHRYFFKGFAIDFHPAVDFVDEVQQFAFHANRHHSRAEFRLAVVGEDQMAQQQGLLFGDAQLPGCRRHPFGADDQMA